MAAVAPAVTMVGRFLVPKAVVGGDIRLGEGIGRVRQENDGDAANTFVHCCGLVFRDEASHRGAQ